MAEVVYVLCALTSVSCTVLLWLSYRKSGMPLLYWSALCFVGLAMNNIFLLGDLVFAPQIDFAIPRNLSGVVALSLFLYGALYSRQPSGGPR